MQHGYDDMYAKQAEIDSMMMRFNELGVRYYALQNYIRECLMNLLNTNTDAGIELVNAITTQTKLIEPYLLAYAPDETSELAQNMQIYQDIKLMLEMIQKFRSELIAKFPDYEWIQMFKL